MTSKIGSFFEALSDKSIDETLVVTEMTLAAVAATSYLAATLDATTPEVKRLFSEYTTQHVMSHEVITSFAVKKGWYSPYDAPTIQLQSSIEHSQAVLGNAQHK